MGVFMKGFSSQNLRAGTSLPTSKAQQWLSAGSWDPWDLHGICSPYWRKGLGGSEAEVRGVESTHSSLRAPVPQLQPSQPERTLEQEGGGSTQGKQRPGIARVSRRMGSWESPGLWELHDHPITGRAAVP